MKKIGAIFVIVLFISVIILRFYVKEGHLPFFPKQEPLCSQCPDPIDIDEIDPDVINLKVYHKILQRNKEALLKNPPIIPVHTFTKSEMSPNASKLLIKVDNPCEKSKELNQILTSSDYTSKIVRSEAIALASANPGEYNLGQLCTIFDYARQSWKYVNDPIGNEYVAKASETIENNYTGDCDDFAVVLGSMLMTIGGDIRINYAFNDTSGHAFVEANLGNTDAGKAVQYIRNRYFLSPSQVINVRKDKRTNNLWLNMDWFANFPGGGYFDYKDGTSYYVTDESCETFSKFTDLIRYEIDGKHYNLDFKEVTNKSFIIPTKK